MKFRNLIDVIKKLGDQYPGFHRRFEEAEAIGQWEAAVGAQIAKHARPVRVKEEILYVEVSHPIWKTELHHRKTQILEVLNRSFVKQRISDIYFYDPRHSRGKPVEKDQN